MELVTTREALLENGDLLILPMEVNYHYIVNQKDAEIAISEIEEFCQDETHFIAVDIETSGLCPYLNDVLLIQIGLPNNKQYIFDMREKINPESLKRVLETPCWKAGHNIKFDSKFLKQKYDIHLTHLFDTFIAEKVIKGGTEEKGHYKLDQVVFRHTNKILEIRSHKLGLSNTEKEVENAKEQMQLSFLKYPEGKPFSAAQLAYAANDTAVLFPLIEKQISILQTPFPNMLYSQWIENISNEETKKFFVNLYPPTKSLWDTALLEFAFLEIVIEMELSGVGFCKKTHKKVMEYVREEYLGHRKDFLNCISKYAPQKTLLGTAAVNPDSPSQILATLRDVLGIKIFEKSTDVKVLTRLSTELPEGSDQKKAVDSMLSYRKMSKLIDAFGAKLVASINKTTGRIHSDINAVIRTGRSSVRHPNFQQIPKIIQWRIDKAGKSSEEIKEIENRLNKRVGFRECFVPKEGYSFIITDYSQQELRIAASVSCDAFMLNAYKHEKDLHSAMAAGLMHISYEEFIQLKDSGDKEAKLKRDIAKTVNFGLVYGLSPYNLAKRMNISVEEAQGIFDRTWQTYPDLKQKLESVHAFANKNGYSNTVMGRQRFYTDLQQRIRWVSAAQTPAQVISIAKDNKMSWVYEGFNQWTGQKNEVTYENLDKVKQKIIQRYQGEISRQAGNMLVQGSAADATKLAAVTISREFLNNNIDAKIVLIVHDELVVEVYDDHVTQAKTIIEAEMNKAMNFFFPLVPSIAESSTGKTWIK